MANENLSVVSIVTRKGGAGKTTIARLLGSSVLASGLRVLFLDTDGQTHILNWAEEAQRKGLWPDEAKCEAIFNLSKLLEPDLKLIE